ncbi:ArnT family glycosyltransferase [Streptomyces regalis]|uniref:Glycosyltransferase n=1 Tax=Streptomyces regalis TaxID=68262 RepID=A0A0X3VIS3_9ACTN|nr:glycosyltransferase family 39 protein [Streptomyces regalis]KUL43356.1 glycosyltransferase [Streptomyces regalis]
MLAELLAPPRSASEPHTERGYWRRLLPTLTLLACVTRIPSFTRPLWNPDEGYLAVQARLLAQGGELYDTVVDRKPPLVPWLYQAAFAVTGSESLTSVRVLAVVAQLLTAVLLASLARRRWGDTAGGTAGVLYLLVSVGLNPEDAQAATFEVFMLPCTTAAMWCADRRRWGSAGLAVAGAFLVKQTGGAVLVPVVWLCVSARGCLLQAPSREARAGGLVRLCAGVVVPVLGVAALTDPTGFLFWTVTGSGAYASFTGSEIHVLARGLTNAAILTLACAGLIPPVLRVLRLARTGAADLWLWPASSAGAVMLGFHFFGHYYLQLLPPLTLLATAALQILPRERMTHAVLTSAFCCALFLTWGLLAPRPELDHARKLADEVAIRTEPQERVLVWGIHPETYWLADRRPASRYLTAGLLTNYSGGRDGPQVGERYAVEGAWAIFREEMTERAPALVVDDSRGKPYGPRRVPGLRRLLAAGYEQAGMVEGAVLYVRSRT